MPRRPRKSNRRMDAAIDHFAAMGYAASDVNSVVGGLVKLYGGPCPDVWRALEENSYEVVLNRLLEIEEEKQKQEQDQQLLLEYNQQQDDQQVEDEPPQHQEPAADNEVEDHMFIEPQVTISISNNEVPAETESADISESEDEIEEQPPGQNHEVHVLNPGEQAK